jgi:uncharacterized protein
MSSRISLCLLIVMLVFLTSCMKESREEKLNKLKSMKFPELVKLADKNNVDAQLLVGDIYSLGDSIKQDHVKAMKYYKKAADAGFSTAQFRMGLLYIYGVEVKKDPNEAERWLLKAAAQNDREAMYYLGRLNAGSVEVLYQTMLVIGNWKVKQFSPISRAYGLADVSDRSEGRLIPLPIESVHLWGAKFKDHPNYWEALKWYRKAAELDYVDAQNELGKLYYAGLGTVKDMSEAYKWFAIASRLQNEFAVANKETAAKELTKQQIEALDSEVEKWVLNNSVKPISARFELMTGETSR